MADYQAASPAPAKGQPKDNKKLCEEQMTIHNELKAERDTHFSVDWQTIGSYIYPNQSDILVKKTENIASWTQNIYDVTGVQSAQILAAGMFNWWTPPNQPWAGYAVPEELKEPDQGDDENDVKDDATIWLSNATDAVMREFGRSNFYSVKGESDNAFAAFATDVMIFDESDSGRELFNFVACKINTYTIEENYKGEVDTLRRELEMTYRQVKQKFKDGEIPDKLIEQGKKDPKRKFKILHCIFPREESERLPKAKDGANKPFASVYIATEFTQVMRVGGYDENPILCRRFAKWGTGAVWGYGPSYLAIPIARELNYVQQYLDALAEKLCYPPMLIPDNLDGDVDVRAGGTTVVDSSDPNSRPAEWALAAEYKAGLELQEQKRQTMRDIFFVDAFKLLNSQPLLDKDMTAYEISQRLAEQLQGVVPAFTRHNTEFNIPIMNRAFAIMFRAGKLKDPPQTLMQPVGQGKSGLVLPEVTATSRFSDALRALKNRGTEETMQFVLPWMPVKPELADYFNWDKTVESYALNAGMPADCLLPSKTVAKNRAARAQIAQQQRAAGLAEQMAGAGAKLGQSPQWMQDQVKQAS